MTQTVSVGDIWADDLTFDQLQRLVGLVDHDASADPFPVRALAKVGARR